MRALVTGGAGFVGAQLCRYLVESGDAVAVFIQPSDDDAAIRPLGQRLTTFLGDIRSASSVDDAIASFQPDVVFHLAGMSFVPDGERSPDLLLSTNLTGTIHVAESVLRRAARARLVFAGSGEVYGPMSADDPPASEDRAPAPVTLYAHSKWFAERMLEHLRLRRGLNVVTLRLFNHIGPGQSPRFSVASFADQLRRIRDDVLEPVIRVGNLEARRDFTDVRDVLRAYRQAATASDPPSILNIASGWDLSLGEVLRRLIELSGLPVRVEVDPERLRPSDVSRLVGSAELARQHLGWSPDFGLDETLRDLLNPENTVEKPPSGNSTKSP
ncbi:MAG: SDR family NAD(P)-dependent oxidoreductase [Deltaproteobacteria bacterium]|nr:SDR family NAD(P)-dependent oxidoreductase [Deltaproteobacteria bacterium]